MICRLEDIANFQKGFAFKSRDFIQEGIRVIKVTNLTDESIDLSSCVHMDESLANNYERYSLQNDDIIITTVGSWPTNPASVVGKVVKVPKAADKSLLNQNAVRVRSNGKVNQKYLYYLLRSDEFKEYIISTAQGSANQASITQKDIKNFKYEIPERETQDYIARILSTIDEKIEVNNQINKTLENMAQAIFKQWFVDFEFPNEDGEPYKSSGGEMVESELGMIPKGWEVGVLGDIISISSGKRPKKKSKEPYEEFVIPLIGASSTMGYVKEYNYFEPIIIIGRVGTHGVVQRFKDKVWASDNTLVIKSEYYEYVHQLLGLIDYASLNRGSTQPLITQTDIKNVRILIPYKSILNQYEELVGKLYELVNSRLDENSNLINLRDTLLPKLMSGEIRVPLDEEGETS